jgi:hypothetical protein
MNNHLLTYRMMFALHFAMCVLNLTEENSTWKARYQKLDNDFEAVMGSLQDM